MNEILDRPLSEEEEDAFWAKKREEAIAASIASANDDIDPQPAEIDGALFQALLVCAHRMRIELAQIVDEDESVKSVLAVQVLTGPRPPITSRELAGALGCSRAAIANTVDRLEAIGWIECHHDLWDRRAKRIVVTDAARKVWADADGAVCALVRKATRSLEVEEKRQLLALLRRVERDLDQTRGERLWQGPPRRKRHVL